MIWLNDRNRMLRVLWISPGFAADENEVNNIPALQHLATALKARGIDIQIISINYPYSSIPYIWHGIPIQSSFKFGKRYLRWINWIWAIIYAIRANRSKKFDVIHSFWLGPAWLIGKYLKKRWHIPHLTTLMGQDVLPANRYVKFLKIHDYENLIALSNFQKKTFEKTTGKFLTHTIPLGLKNEDIIYNLTNQRPIDVLGCGSLSDVKNWPLWIEVVAKLVNRHPKIRAEIIGSGSRMIEMQNLITSFGIENKVTISSNLSRPQVLVKMAMSKVFLHTSNFESFGMVLLEAYANGCEVISTPVGIASEIGHIGSSAEELLKQLEIQLFEKKEKKKYQIKNISETALEYEIIYSNRIYTS